MKQVSLILLSLALIACTTNNITVNSTSPIPNPPVPTQDTVQNSTNPSIQAQSNWKTYTNTKEGYKINYPDTWYQKGGFESTIGSSEYYLSNEDKKYTELSKDGVYLFIKRDNGMGSPENDPEKNFNFLYKNLPEAKSTTLAGTSAVKITQNKIFDASSNGDSEKDIIQYALMHNNKIYILELREKFNGAVKKNAQVFDEIAQTFSFDQ